MPATSAPIRFLATLVTAALAWSTPAMAGGVSPIVTGGFHTEKVYFYSREQQGGAGAVIRDPNNYERYDQNQLIGQVGSGLEVVLGDRDDLIQGVFRGFWMMDTPQIDPGKSGLVDADALVAAWRTDNRHVGAATVGIQWGIVRAAQEKFVFGASLHAGSGFLTTDHSEFLLVQAGANVRYQVARPLEVFLDVDYGLRVRKDLSHGLYTTAGVRVMFD
jgi:hypothetical protein